MPMSQEEIAALLTTKANRTHGRPTNDHGQIVADIFYRHGFDRAALFLLGLGFENLFEPWLSEFTRTADGFWFRCKGCQRMVKRTGRQSHHEWHKRELMPSAT